MQAALSANCHHQGQIVSLLSRTERLDSVQNFMQQLRTAGSNVRRGISDPNQPGARAHATGGFL